MYRLHTEKQRLYFDEVIRLHYEEGYGQDRISHLLPVGHSTASRCIAIFAKEKGEIAGAKEMKKPKTSSPSQDQSKEVEALQYVKEIHKFDPSMGILYHSTVKGGNLG